VDQAGSKLLPAVDLADGFGITRAQVVRDLGMPGAAVEGRITEVVCATVLDPVHIPSGIEQQSNDRQLPPRTGRQFSSLSLVVILRFTLVNNFRPAPVFSPRPIYKRPA
jgi:hypothetical protein